MSSLQTNNHRLKYKATKTQGECTINEINPVKLNYCKFTIFIFFSILFVTLPLLLVLWYPNLKRIFYYDYCPLEEATHVAVLNYDDGVSICQITEEVVYFNQNDKATHKLFTNRYLKYIIGDMVQAQIFDFKSRIRNIINQEEKGLSNEQVQQLRRCYGLGTMVIQKRSPLQILVKDLLRPLYLFLFFNVSIWLYQEYYAYSGIILGSIILAIVMNLIQMVQMNNKIYNMAFYEIKMNVLREGKIKEVSSLDIVPGDIVFLKKAIKIPFEGIILEGSLLINQCALTGQSVPVVKKADPIQRYRSSHEIIDKSAEIYEGTTIIQVNSKKKMNLFESAREEYGIPVCVTKTNFITTKGQLIRVILFPKEQENIFQKESTKFLFFLFLVATITFFGMLKHFMDVSEPTIIVIQFLSLVGITVPSALPVSMAFGVVYAIDKLKDKLIFCIDSSKIINGGVVDHSCFDKTGTLTEDFMDFQCLIPADHGKFYPTITNRPNDKPKIEELINRQKYLKGIFNNMASNHTIIALEETGELVGDPMEIKLIQFGEFSLNQTNSNPQIIFSFESKRNQTGQVYRRFQFDSDVQRMSVVCKTSNEYYVYTKGSPQIMLTIMDKTTVPSNYQSVLKEYASNGFRVLAIASKKIDKNFKILMREQIESELFFNGFQVFENKLKKQTKGAIKQLKSAQISVVMITGDNPLTGSNIGYKCGISDKSKGMLICDYKNGKFHQSKFVYFERQQTAHDEFENTLEQLQTKEQLNAPFGQIIIHTTKYKTQKTQAPEDDFYFQLEPEQYIQDITKRAKNTKTQLCVTGNAFNVLFSGPVKDLTPQKIQFLGHVKVFARTKPNDKAKIVMAYQHSGKTVSMCGDGANDCEALKQADIGLSLSQAQASISAPFTSQVSNITSMVELIKQCRAGLATNFSLFNIMASYSLIQYTTITICFLFYAVPPDYNYLYQDLACNFFFIIVIGYTSTADKLSIQKPNNSLFCLTNLLQVMIAFGIQVLGQISMVLALEGPFNDDVNYKENGGIKNGEARYYELQFFSRSTPETNILFLFSNYMLISTLISFTIGEPWRKSFFTNKPFMFFLAFAVIYSILITIIPETRLSVFQIAYMGSTRLNGFVLGVGIGFGIFIFLLQKWVLQPISLWLRKTYSHIRWL